MARAVKVGQEAVGVGALGRVGMWAWAMAVVRGEAVEEMAPAEEV